MIRRIAVFCGSSSGRSGRHAEAAHELGTRLGRQGFELVYGGGRVGLMGVVADACLQAGGPVTGVIPRALADREVAHLSLTQLHVVGTMHERKALMADLSDAFVALPGGYGTWDELFEALTWTQLGIQQKPCGLLNVAGYYDPLVSMIDQALAEGFIRPEFRHLLLHDSTVSGLLDRLIGTSVPRGAGGPGLTA